MTSRTTALGLSAALSLLAVAGCGSDDASYVGYQIDPAPQVGHLTVTDASHGGEPMQLRAEPGRLLVVFLGFTNCPDACPTAMTDVRLAFDQLGVDADTIDLGMLTIDPVRDTPEVLTAYVQRYVEDAHALRVEDPQQLQDVVDAFGATYAAEHDHEGDTVEVGHTDYTYLVDDTGAVVLTWTNEMTVDDIVSDLRLQLDEL